MEHIKLPNGPAEREGSQVQARAQSLEEAPTSDAYRTAHDEVSRERLEEMKKYLRLEGFENNDELRENVLEYLTRNYEASDLEKVGVSEIYYENIIKFFYTLGDGNESREYTREEYERAKKAGELPSGNAWLRVRAQAAPNKEHDNYGQIKLFDVYDYPYQMPDVVEGAENKEEALLKYLLSHEIGHFYFNHLYTTESEDGTRLRPERLADTSFGQLYAVRGEDGNLLLSSGMGFLMENPFTPYLQTRVKVIKPLYDSCIEKKEYSSEFLTEFSEYLGEFFAESAAISKNKQPDDMSDLEKYFVGLYEEMENLVHTGHDSDP